MINDNYIKFITDNFPIEMEIPFNVPKCVEYFPKISPKLFVNVRMQIIKSYTRSVKIHLEFDKYEKDLLCFISTNKSPDSILKKLRNEVHDLVNKTYIDDGREGEIEYKYTNLTKSLPKWMEY